MTLGAHADWLYVLCRTDGSANRHRGISMLLIPADRPGVDVRPIMAGGREFAEVFFTDARTPLDHVVGDINGGWRVVVATLGNERGGATILPFQAAFERELHELLEDAPHATDVPQLPGRDDLRRRQRDPAQHRRRARTRPCQGTGLTRWLCQHRRR
jgi:hypothetical protein